MNLNEIAFYVISGLTIAAALGVVLSRNIVHSALALIVTFLGVAMTFFELDAGFLGLVQILVYAGAISVLIIFAIMLVMHPDPSRTNLTTPSRDTNFWGGLLAWIIIAAIGIALGKNPWPIPQTIPTDTDRVGAIANLLLGNYVVAFEAAAVLLLLAVAGAIILAKGVEEG